MAVHARHREEQVEVLDLAGPGPAGTEHLDTGGPGTGAVVLLAIVAAAALWLLGGAATGGDVGDEGAPPTPTTAPVPPTSVPGLAARTGTDLDLLVGVVTPAGEPARVLRWSSDEAVPLVEPTVHLWTVAADVSGRWLAGVGPTPATGLGPVLWVGRAGEALEPVALEPVDLEARASAWHDTRPGLLAWTSRGPDGSSRITVLDLSGPTAFRRTLPVGDDLRLQRWGDWGFALTTSGRTSTTTLLGPDGTPVGTAPGLPGGWLTRLGLLVTDPDSPLGGVAVLAADGSTSRLAAARFAELAWDVAVAPDGERAAVHLVRGEPGGATEGRIVVVDAAGAVLDEADDVRGFAALAWSTDGERLLFARQAPGRTPEVVLHDPDTGTEVAVPLPELSAARDTITALAAVAPAGAAGPGLAPEGEHP